MPRQNLNLLVGGMVDQPMIAPKTDDGVFQLILAEIKALRRDLERVFDTEKILVLQVDALKERIDELEKWQAVMIATHPRRTVGVGVLGAAGATFVEVSWKVYQAIMGSKHP